MSCELCVMSYGPAMLMKYLRGGDLEADIAAHLAAEDSRIAAEKQKKKQAAKQRKKLNEQKRGNRDREDRTEYMSTYDAERNKTTERKTEKAAYDAACNAKHKRVRTQAETDKAKTTERKTEKAAYDAARNHKRVRTQAEKDKAKDNRKKKRAASKDKGSKILDQKRPAINNN